MAKQLDFISAYSEAEALKVIKDNPDVAIILLDVVMDQDDSGLKIVKYIRDELKYQVGSYYFTDRTTRSST